MKRTTFQEILARPMDHTTRMQLYPLLLASVAIDAGGEIEITEKAFSEACEIVRLHGEGFKTGIMEFQLDVHAHALRVRVETVT